MYVTFALLGFCLINLFSVSTLTVPGQYATIQLAVDEALTLTGDVTIEVSEGTYNEYIYCNLNDTDLTHLSLIGVDGADNCIINSTVYEQNGVVVFYWQNSAKFFKISGFTINCINANAIQVFGLDTAIGDIDVEIVNNIILNNGDHGEGIKLFSISKCVILGNTITIDSPSSWPCSGISIDGLNSISIESNHVSNYFTNLWIRQTNGIIKNNIIETWNYSSDGGTGIDVSSSSLDIINNLIMVNQCGNSESYGLDVATYTSYKIINNTIIGLGDYTTGIRALYSLNIEKFANNIMWNLDQNIELISIGFEVNYCCYNGTIPAQCEPEPIENHNVININPLLTPDYHLSEDSTLLIDGGDPDTNGNGVSWLYDEDDRDIDGSRKDMGCYPYFHDYDTKVFTKGVHWISFPVLTPDGTYVPYPPSIPSIPPIDNELFQQAYEENDDPGLLQDETGAGTIDGFIKILGNRYGIPMKIEPVLSNYEDHDDNFKNMLFRHEGYKIEIGSVATPTTLIVGDGIDDERLPVNYEISGSMDTDEYHWIGYWIPRTQNMKVAFGDGTQNDFWQHVAKVKSEDWFYSPANNQRGDDPTYPIALDAENLTLEYGKAYLVLFNEQIEDFRWTDSSITVEAERKSEPESFTYTEKTDYEAIDVFNIPPNVSKIGVFEDDICVGAVVVEDTCAQILVYSDNANSNPVPFTFEVVTGRGFSTPIKDYQVLNLQTGEYETKSIFSSRQDYSVMRFSEEEELEDNILSTPQLHGNYPNPFNPTTTISFSLPEEQEVDLAIYNIKGQKVKRLINGQLTAGQHSMIWDGKDTNGKSVSTGIYFYRLKTGKKEMSRKMLLLK